MSAFENADVKNASAERNSNEAEYIKIGNTTFAVVSHYLGERTYEDIVKSALRRETEKNY